MVERLTDRQQEALDFIRAYTEDRGYPPTMRELADGLGLSGPKGAKEYMDILERKGYIRREPESSRALTIIDGGRGEGDAGPGLFSRLEGIPVVGRVAAGMPITAVENIEGYFTLAGRRTDDLFMLRVSGDSMIEAHIAPGDMVLVNPLSRVENGDIVVALLDGEATVKRYKTSHRPGPEGSGVVLYPENRTMQPIFVDGGMDFSIVGKVVGVVRDMEGDLVMPE
ncbi:MAG: transcriptional repressor LexA [Deltaproteobacteria bacterium]|nr:transcriptional repressor LexA [Candidatus Zymogenaceae bacterium]